MSFIKRILKVFGFQKENLGEQFNAELKLLQDLQLRALQPYVKVEDISPTVVLTQTGIIKELIFKLQREGLLNKDEKLVNYTISNITMQENTIAAFGVSYTNDIPIYSSQIAASITEILKDIALLLH